MLESLGDRPAQRSASGARVSGELDSRRDAPVSPAICRIDHQETLTALVGPAGVLIE